MTVDLTGLPEPVVRQVMKLVREARERQGETQRHGTPGTLATEPLPTFTSDPKPSPEESRRLLDEMAAMGTG